MTKIPLHHGMKELDGAQDFCSLGHDRSRSDRFGRLFPDIPPSYVNPKILSDIGSPKGLMDGGKKKNRTKTVPVGMVFFGQFIDHDITLDVTSSFSRVNQPSDITNQRTPTLDLDCIYGAGPEATPFLYLSEGEFANIKLATGADEFEATEFAKRDLFRASGQSKARGRAIIGDPRNDENGILRQMQLGMIQFHNLIVDEIHASEPELEGAELFEKAREETTHLYQWSVVNDFLVSMCGKAVVDDILSCGRRHYCASEPFIPVEFSVAAFRFGHSMIPQKINIQKGKGQLDLFGSILGGGFAPLEDFKAVVDWNELLVTSANRKVQMAETLDTKLASILLALPFVEQGGEASLATRNLLRSNSFLLPAGEHIAAQMGRSQVEIDKVLKFINEITEGDLAEGIPLWLYILAEAEMIGRETEPNHFDKGEGLGPVGARIVAEVIIGLLELDPLSYLGSNRNWHPEKYESIGEIMAAITPDEAFFDSL